MLLFILLLCVQSASSHVTSTASEWTDLTQHKMAAESIEHLTDGQLTIIINEEWSHLRDLCPNIPHTPSMLAYFDNTLVGTFTLAWASQSLTLGSDLLWYPALLSGASTSGYQFIIGVNPSPPNGWYTGSSCTDIGYRFDLRTVLKHELLHGLALASSISIVSNTWTLGHAFLGICYPRLYDTKIQDSDGNSIVGLTGCIVGDLTGKDLYMNGVPLYNPLNFNSGSSISHHNYDGHLMYYAIRSKTCMDLGKYEALMLSELGVTCTVGGETYDSGNYLIPSSAVSTLSILALLLWTM